MKYLYPQRKHSCRVTVVCTHGCTGQRKTVGISNETEGNSNHYSKYEFEEEGFEGTPSNQPFTTGRHYQKLKPTSLKPLSYILRPGKVPKVILSIEHSNRKKS